MNNIEACRQPARDEWKPLWRRGGEKVKVKRQKKDSGVNTNTDSVYCVLNLKRDEATSANRGWRSDVPRKLRETSGLRWLTCKRRDSSQTPAPAALLRHSLPLRVPSSAPAEIWRLPSLINVKAAPINIFISARAPRWKHILGDFSLYELISYLQRQLNMPPPPFVASSFPPAPSELVSFPIFPPFLHSAEKECEHLGFTRRATDLEDWKFPFQSFSFAKVWVNPLTARRHAIW